MKSLLTLKHWQLFLVFISVPSISILVGIVVSLILKEWWLPVFFTLFSTLITTILFMVYQYSVVYHLTLLYPKHTPANLHSFKICLSINVVILLAMLMIMWKIMNLQEAPLAPNLGLIFLLFFVVLLSITCSLFIFFIMSKALVTVEQQRPITFSDHALEFFLFWFWIIGIWVLQPRLNEIFSLPADHIITDVPPPLPIMK